ncbi:hypothetical protein V8C86DRAFT_2931762, partial [Haematococcus lacustris]
MCQALQALGPLSLPATSPNQPLPVTPVPLQHLTSLSWSSPTTSTPRVFPTLIGTPVRVFTSMLTPHITSARKQAHLSYITQALSTPHPPTTRALALQAFTTNLNKAWKVPCSNLLKETLWRLSINAIPGSRITPWSCPCDPSHHPRHSRQHSFWSCPIAITIRQQLSLSLGTQVHQSSLWCLIPPRPPHPPT